MCRPRPYPRCSNYARKALQEAAAKYNSTPNPTAADFNTFVEAKRTYDLTPEGINALRSAGKHDEAKQMESERKLLIAIGDATTSTSPEQLEALSQHSHRKVRIAVAKNPNTQPKTLSKLADDERNEEDVDLLVAVASNPRTSGKVLSWLAYDETPVQYAVARNPNTPKKTISLIVEEADDDSNEDLLMVALANPNVSRKVLKRALSYAGDDAADTAADRLPVSVLAEVVHNDNPARAKVAADGISRRSRDELVDYLVSEGGNREDFADLPDSWLIASITERV